MEGEENGKTVNVLSVDDWAEKWKDGKIGFHKTHVHQCIQNHFDKMVAGREKIKIFVPLCGKTLDIKWFYDSGHEVVGIEVVKQPIIEFFQDNNLEFTSEPAEKVQGTLYKTMDNRIKFYQCNIFSFSQGVEGQFDGIWDRGAFNAINKEDQERYTTLLMSLMAPECKYLLVIVDFDDNIHPGPPFRIPEDNLPVLYDKCNVKMLEKVDSFEERHKQWGIEEFYELYNLLSLK